jgi:hypothetical protein
MNKPESCINQNYTGFWFIQDSGLFRILVYTGFWFIQDSGLFRIQDSGLFRVLVYTGFWFIQDSGWILHSVHSYKTVRTQLS